MKKTILFIILLLATLQTIFSQTKQSFKVGLGYFRDIELSGQGVGTNIEYNRSIGDGMEVGCDVGLGQFNNDYRYTGQLKYLGLHISFLPIENPKFKLSFTLGPQYAYYKSLHLLVEHFRYQNNILIQYDQLYGFYDKQLWGLYFNLKTLFKVSNNIDFFLSAGFLKYQEDNNFFTSYIGFSYNF